MNPKGNKETDIGLIPEDWDVTNLKKYLEIHPNNGIYKSKEYQGRGIKLIKMDILFDNYFIHNQEMELLELNKEEKEKFLVEDGDLIFARTSLVLEGVGKCAIVDRIDEEMAFESNTFRIKLNKNLINPKYILYFFRSDYGKNYLYSIANQTAATSIRSNDLTNLLIPIPNLEEQNKIANILYIIDKKIQLNKQMNQTLESIGKAIFKHWFVHFEFPDENGKPYKSSGGEMVDSELGEIPAGWKVKELGNFIKFIKGKKPKEVFEFAANGLLPQILIDTLDGKDPYYANPDKMVITQLDDPIMVMDGASSGRISIGHKGVLGSTLSKIKLNNDLLSNYFVYYILRLNEKDINENTTGTSIPHTDKERINKYALAVPEKTILNRFNHISSSIIMKIILNREEIKNIVKIRDSLLPKLMSGKIRVPMEATENERFR